jgi:TPR repeat protein
LGVQYYTIAIEQRGDKFASETTREQWAEMAKYADLAHAAFVRSLSLTPDPLPTYSQLIKLAAFVKRPAAGAAPVMERVSMEMKRKKSFCPAAGFAGADFKTAWAEEIYYLCLARKADPDAIYPFRNLVSYNIPRWGVGYATLQQLYDELAADHRTAPLQLGMMKAYVLAAEASDVADSGTNAHLAAQLYEQAFDAAPIGENMEHLYSAMYQEWKQAKNFDQAIRLANRALAVRKGEWQAYYDGGLIYQEMGDLRKYMEYQIAAANLGVAEAQNNVGYSYMVGQRGLPRDLHEAKAWLTLSANQGFEHAREKLAVVDAMIAKEKK